MTDEPTPPSPDYLYRIIVMRDWEDALRNGVVPYKDLDLRDGFLHLSTREQAVETAGRYFTSQQDLIALEIIYVDIKDHCRFEPAPSRNGEMFPHLYGQLPVNAVNRALRLNETAPGRFIFGEVVA